MTSALEISEVRCVARLGALLGEGPLYDPRNKSLYSLDIKGEKVFRTDVDSEQTTGIAIPGMISALGLRKSGGFVCAMRDGFALLSIEGDQAKITPIADPEKELPGNRFNDGKVDPLGGFWAGTMDDKERSVTGSWWRLAPGGVVLKIDAGYHITNGPAFDPANGRVFLTDSAKQTVFLAETDGATLVNKRVFLQFGAGDGYPDGMEVDSEGCMWIAFWDGWSVKRFSPEGELLLDVKMPVPRPTSVAIADGKLFVTSASVGLKEEAMDKAPFSGGLFCVELSKKIEGPLRYFDDAAFA